MKLITALHTTHWQRYSNIVHKYFSLPPGEAAESVTPTASNQDRAYRLGLMTLRLVAAFACLSSTVGCSNGATKEIGHKDESADSSESESLATDADVQALAGRLERITQEVAQSPEGRVYGVNTAANFEADQVSPLGIRKVVMHVNVYECDDGCVNGPADTPAEDEDLLLLLPFRSSIEELDLQRTHITDAGLESVADLINLESLDLAGTGIHGSGLAHLSTLTKLKHLNLSRTNVEPEYLQALGALPSLHSVLIPNQAITDEVLAVLGRLPKLQRLALAIPRLPIGVLAAWHNSNLLRCSTWRGRRSRTTASRTLPI